jgi:hypothetical protein
LGLTRARTTPCRVDGIRPIAAEAIIREYPPKWVRDIEDYLIVIEVVWDVAVCAGKIRHGLASIIVKSAAIPFPTLPLWDFR